jgi:hypothetical protein
VSKAVNILGRGRSKTWEVEGTIRCIDGKLVADTPAAKSVLRQGFHWNGRDYDEADGEDLLEILPLALNGSYEKAVAVDEDAGLSRHARGSAAKPRGGSSIPLLLREFVSQEKLQKAEKKDRS